ncbi:penicillin acylase family protein [Sorangium sp. So ce1335]|uniref:penicillin acylase family protein n=1 Tax=Sorangium sp. So ce1335 TaxID=3133335 RepID=UPI003F63ED69
MRLSFSSAHCVLALVTGLTGMLGCSDDPGPGSSAPDAGAPSDPDAGAPDGSPPSSATFGPLGDRPDLPVDGRLTIDGLLSAVDVVQDRDGRPHIYAENLVDAMRVEGYLTARDRALQLEILRRTAEGRLAELFGELDPTTIDQDIALRHVGLGRIARAQYDALPEGELRQMLDAYADGVTQVFRKIRSGDILLPEGATGIPAKAFTDWSGVDSLVISRFQSYLLSFDAELDITMQQFFDAARTTFASTSADPLAQKRAGLERDFLRFAPSEPAVTSSGYPASPAREEAQKAEDKAAKRAPRARRPGRAAQGRAELISSLAGYLSAVQRARSKVAPEGFGSNNWAIHASRSATGHALVASDPHLSLSAPAVWYAVSIHVTAPEGKDASRDVHVGGVTFPGIPGIILGHNERVGWGATVAMYDVTDVYAEKLTPDGKAVLFKGNPVPLQTVEEVIAIAGREPYTYRVPIVPHHGPILPTIVDHAVVDPDPAVGALSVRWTGLEPTKELEAIFGLLRARSVDEAQESLSKFSVGAQNWVMGDAAGDILWTTHAAIPTRSREAFAWDAATYTGVLPCLVLPGDGTAEWTGTLPEHLIPRAKNPPAGYIATANNDPIGDSLDNDPSNGALPDGTPMYLGCSFDIGFREGRIQERIDAHEGPLSPEDCAAIQGDIKSALGARLVPHLLRAIDRAGEERASPGTHADLSALVADATAGDLDRLAAQRALLDGWGKEADYKAAAGVDLDTGMPLADEGDGPGAIDARASEATLVFNVWLVRVVRRVLGDELGQMGFSSFSRELSAKALLHLFSADREQLATFDPAVQDSALWDDMGTPAVESRDERVLRALLDALAWLDQQGGAGAAAPRWGAFHTVTFDALVPVFSSLSIPPPSDPLWRGGFPRGGDEFAVDSSDYRLSWALDESPDFRYVHGPSQRLVVELDPAGPKAWNAIPGGNVWDAESPHFRDQAELWRKNQTHLVPFLLPDVIQAKESRTVVEAP